MDETRASVNHCIVSPAYSPIEYKVMHSLSAQTYKQMEFVVLSDIDELESGHHRLNPFYSLGT